ncbi:MAG: hypothetical protein ABI399_12180, partial [Bauldia sp.]
MPNSVRDFVDTIKMVDVHEHHFPEVLLNPEVNLLQLFRESYAGWTQVRPYPLPSETLDPEATSTALRPTTWEELSLYLDGSGSNSFVRNLVRAVLDLYGKGADAITHDNW